MDLNCLTWKLIIVVVDQFQLQSMLSLVLLLLDLKVAMQCLPHPGADSEVIEGKDQQLICILGKDGIEKNCMKAI